MTAAQAVQLIESGDSIYIQGSTSIPEVLSQALADRGHELKDVTIYAAFAVGRCEAPYCKPEYKDAFNVKSLFVANNVRKWLAQGYGSTIPAFWVRFRDFSATARFLWMQCSSMSLLRMRMDIAHMEFLRTLL